MQKQKQKQKGVQELIYNRDLLPLLPENPNKDSNFKTIFSKSIQTEVRMDSGDQVNQVAMCENLMFTISRKEEALKAFELKIRVESQKDVFFHYRSQIDEECFAMLREVNQLDSGLGGFVSGVIDLFVKIYRKPADFLLIFYIDPNGGARLEVTQNFDYKVM